jgi:hypothetical protein
LLSAGVTLSDDHIRALYRAPDLWLLMADSTDELVAAGILDRLDS